VTRPAIKDFYAKGVCTKLNNTLSDCDAQNPYIRHHYSSAIEVPLIMLRHYLHTYNATVATRFLVPTAVETMTFFDQHWANTSVFFMEDAQNLESYSHCDQPHPQLAGLTQLLRGLLLPHVSTLFAAADLAMLKHLQARVRSTQLPLYTTLKHMNPPIRRPTPLASALPLLAPCGRGGDAMKGYWPGTWEQQNGEPTMMYAAWPYELMGINRTFIPELWPAESGIKNADDAFQLGVRSYINRPYPVRPMVGYNEDSVFAVQFGLVDEARAQLNVKWTSKKGPDDYAQARFPVWWGPSREAPDETCDYPGCDEIIDEGRITLQHMLLQTDNHGERLLLFPAWPKAWPDLSFKLFAERNTTIEGELKGGKLVSLLVTPAERRKDVVVLPLKTDE